MPVQKSRLMPVLRWLACAFVAMPGAVLAESRTASHPPLRTAPAPSQRPLASGPAYFVDGGGGNDQNDGSRDKPWKTINRALTSIHAGDTLYLRGGTYYEQVALRLIGKKDAPITLRCFPGEQAVIDGGLREFFDEPATAWAPFADGAEGEFRSARTYPNVRHVLGAFGDSMVGLVAYYHAKDLRAKGEFFELDEATKDFQPLYCGPGIWYDPTTGYIHARLAPTNVPGIANYRGESDPRKLPLVIAPFRSLPLHVDGAQHVRFQDLIIRGGGYDAVVLDQCSDIEFDNVTVWCGSYGVRATGVHRLKFLRSALHGSIPPWLSRSDSSLQSYPGRPQRDIARLNTHALLVTECGREFSVYAFPVNDDWEIAYSEFTEGSDGLYLGGVSMRFHHNIVDNMQDDGLYLSPMYPRHFYLRGGATLHLYQNYFSRALTMLAYGGAEGNQDKVYFYRNIIDLRGPVQHGRPSSKSPGAVAPYAGKVMGDHGSPPWPAMFTYHNTVISREPARSVSLGFTDGSQADRPRRVFNNILVHGAGLATFAQPDVPFVQTDGNLFWQPGLDAKLAGGFFNAYRASAAFASSKKVYPPGFEAHSLVADPKFVRFALAGGEKNDYRLQPASPAVDAGVLVPADWPDPLRAADKGKPDMGALPEGAEPLQVGRTVPTKP